MWFGTPAGSPRCKPKFDVHSIANRRDRILVVECRDRILVVEIHSRCGHIYTHIHVMGDVVNCVGGSLDVFGET